MADLNTDIRYIKGVGETRAKAFEKLGVFTLGDLIAYYPRRWEDRSQLYPIRDLPEGEYACCKAMIAQPPTAARIRGGQTLVQVRAVDEGGVLDVSFFHQEYRKNVLHPGETYIFYGKVEGGGVRRRMVNPLLETEGKQLLTGRIMPIYPLTAGLTQTMVAKAVRQGLDQCRDLPEDVLPDGIRQAHHLCYAGFAYENIHFPASEEALNTARRRLVFEELFLLSCGLSLLRQRRETVAGLPCQAADMAPFYAALPFALTAAQRRAIADAVGDMTSGRPMNRLCQGDVGSGKTMVAAACVWFAAQSGWQSALMAPTEILARQHYENLAPLFARFGLPCALLTGSTPARERRAILAGLQSGDITLCIGTHALLTADVQYARLGLVITDEQHRFGVEQRSALSHKGAAPHTLVLSATPIPRTLALIIYGDLDVSVIDELPPGRQTVETFALGEKYRARLNGFIRKQVQEGHQVFIVCPLVGEDDALPDERKAVTAYAKAAAGGYLPRAADSRTPRPYEAKGEGKDHGRLRRRGERYLGLHHRGGGGRGCAQRHADGGGERRPLRPEPAAPAARPGGPRPGQELLCSAQRRTERRHETAAESPDPDERRLPHRRGGPEAPGPRRLLRQPPARPAHAEGRRPQLRYAPAGRGPGCRAAAAGRRPAADPAGARRAPPPGAGPVPGKGRHSELKQGTLSALEMPAISSGAGTMFRRRCSLLSPRRLPGGMGQIFPRK